MVLAGVLVFFLVLIPGFRVIDTIVETLNPSEYTILRWIAERVLFIIAIGSLIGILCIPALIAAYREAPQKSQGILLAGPGRI